MYSVLQYVFSTSICIQYFNMYSVLQYGFSTSTWIQYINMDSVLQYGFSTSIWIQYFNMDLVLQYGFGTSKWIQYFNMNSVLQHGFSTSIWVQYFNMDSVLQYGFSPKPFCMGAYEEQMKIYFCKPQMKILMQNVQTSLINTLMHVPHFVLDNDLIPENTECITWATTWLILYIFMLRNIHYFRVLWNDWICIVTAYNCRYWR